MRLLASFALCAACVGPSEAVAGRFDDSESGVILPTLNGTTGIDTSSSATKTQDSDHDSTQQTPSSTNTKSKSEAEADAESSESADDSSSELETGTPADESDSEETGTWAACGGVVPTECIEIIADTATCPGPIPSCNWFDCWDERTTRARIDQMECFERVCGVEPLYDLDCLEEWAELARDCFDNDCNEDLPMGCQFISTGSAAECHR